MTHTISSGFRPCPGFSAIRNSGRRSMIWTVSAPPAGSGRVCYRNVRLFVNALPEIACPPYGSFYLEGTLMGKSTVRLNQLYNEYGFQTSELADHIAVELEFFALLTTLTSHAQVQPDYEFLRDHLRRWTAPFFDRVQKNDDTGFYAAAAMFAGAF